MSLLTVHTQLFHEGLDRAKSLISVLDKRELGLGLLEKNYLQACIREFKKPRGRRWEERHKFAYLTMKNSSFARSARAFFILVNFTAVFVLPRCEMSRFVVWTTGEFQGKVSFFSFFSKLLNLISEEHAADGLVEVQLK